MGTRHRKTDFQFDLSGGALSLDFANTVSGRIDPEAHVDHVQTYDDLIAFAQQSKLLPTTQAGALRSDAGRHPEPAAQVLHTATALREAVYRTFSALAAGKPAASADLRHIEREAIEAMGHRSLERSNGDYRWDWKWDSANRLERVLWPIAQSAAELLTSGDFRDVHECEARNCAWLFLDKSRNGSRRWCDMKICGNREKARRHYERSHT